MKSKGLIGSIGLLLALVFICIATFNSEVQASGKYESVVVGMGDSSVDVPNVQAAVDQGGKILLKGTFDFGEEGSVSVLHDVEIIGDDASIMNGKQAFAVGFDSSLPDGGDLRHQEGYVGPQVAFKNLKFENAHYSSIHVLATSGLSVKGCTFEDGKYFNYYGPLGGHFSIFLTGAWTIWSHYTGESADITGDIIIKDNLWEGRSRVDLEDGYWAWFNENSVPMNGISMPFSMMSGKDVQVKIENNESYDSAFYHFSVVNIQGEDSTISIKNNVVENDSDNIAQASVVCMCDMHQWTADMYPGLSELEPGDPTVSLIVKDNQGSLRGDTIGYTSGFVIGSIENAVIKDNKLLLDTNGYSAGGDTGIGLQGVSNSIIKNNEIILNEVPLSENLGYSTGIQVWASRNGSHYNTISNNIVRGATHYGITVGDPELAWPASTNNLIVDNDLSQLTLVDYEYEFEGRIYAEGHVLFAPQSGSNVYYGQEGDIVLDFGSENEYLIRD